MRIKHKEIPYMIMALVESGGGLLWTFELNKFELAPWN